MRKRAVSTAVLVVVLLLAATGAIIGFEYWPGADREARQLASLVDLRPGMPAGEIGAGNGALAVRIAQKLGPSGQLFVTELESHKLRKVQDAAERFAVKNLVFIQAGEHSTGLPERCCDFVYMRRVYHHLSDAGAINKSLYAALRPGGRLVVIDQLLQLPFYHDGIESDAIVKEVTAAGFALDRPASGWFLIDYCLVFTRRPQTGER